MNLTVFFRYDDFCATSDAAVDAGVIAAFQAQHLCCTFAVIPRVTVGNYRDPSPRACHDLDAGRRQMLAVATAAGAIDVALHGFEHRSNGLGMPHSEFRGLPYDAQADKIRRGRAMLEEITGQPVVTFVPPWNTYDADTLQALTDNGMRCLSANRYGSAPEAGSLCLLPITVELFDLESAVAAARAQPSGDPVIGVLMHPYDFRESGDERARADLPGLGRKLQWLATQTDVTVAPVSVLASDRARFSSQRYAANQPLRLEDLMPPFVGRVGDLPFYPDARAALAVQRRRALVTAGVHLFAALAGLLGGWLAGRSLLPDHTLLATALFGAAGAGFAAIGLRALLRGEIFFRPMLLLGLSGGGLLGGALALLFPDGAGQP